MQEALRQQMLQAMGRQVLVPRFAFPNAKPSVVLSPEPVCKQVLQPKAEVVAASEAAPASIAVDKTVISEMFKETLQQVSNMPDEKVHEQNKPYRHCLVIFSGIIFLLDRPSIEWLEEPQHMQFLNNVFQAVTNKRTELNLQDKFEWPPGKGSLLPDSESKGIEQAFLVAQAQRYSARWLVICSEEVAGKVLEEPVQSGEAAFVGELSTLVMHDVQHYINNPLHKRILWQSLQLVCQSFK